MARELGVGVMPWSPLAGGVLTGKYSRKDLEREGSASPEGSRADVVRQLGMLTERNLAIADEVVAVAKEIDATPARSLCAGWWTDPGSAV